MALRKYPWEDWFGRPRTTVRRGIDYQLSQSMMYATIKNNASLRKVRIRLKDTGDGFLIEVIDGVSKHDPRDPDKTTVTPESENALDKTSPHEEETARRSVHRSPQRNNPPTTPESDTHSRRTAQTR